MFIGHFAVAFAAKRAAPELVLVYVANIWGPAPENTTVVAWSAQAIWLLVGLGVLGGSASRGGTRRHPPAGARLITVLTPNRRASRSR